MVKLGKLKNQKKLKVTCSHCPAIRLANSNGVIWEGRWYCSNSCKEDDKHERRFWNE